MESSFWLEVRHQSTDQADADGFAAEFAAASRPQESWKCWPPSVQPKSIRAPAQTGSVSAVGGALRAVTVARKKGPDGKPLSAGYGFVECSSEAAAKAAVRALQGYHRGDCAPLPVGRAA